MHTTNPTKIGIGFSWTIISTLHFDNFDNDILVNDITEKVIFKFILLFVD